MINPLYSCTQQELYAVCRLAWDNCEDDLADFTNFKAFYIAAFIVARFAEITAAENLPDDQARSEPSETLAINLKTEATTCLKLWQKLKRYIASAYPANVQKPKQEAAGSLYYESASNDNWEDVKGLMVAGSNFIANNSVALMAGNNMPLLFQATFNSGKNAFIDVYEDFLVAEETSVEGTQDKLEANNALHTAVMTMLLDGQEIYADDFAKQQKYIFAQLLQLVSPPINAGAKGDVTESVTDAPLEGAEVHIQHDGDPEVVMLTDVNGHYEKNQLKSGNTTIRVVATGYVTQEIFENIPAGTVITRDFVMVKV